MNVCPVTEETIRQMPDTALLGWFSPSLGYSHVDNTRGELHYAGLNVTSDAIPVWCDFGYQSEHQLTGNAQKQIGICFLGQMFNAFNVDTEDRQRIEYSAKYYPKVLSQEFSRFVVYSLTDYDGGRQMQTRGSEFAYGTISTEKVRFYGSWFAAASVPGANGNAKRGATWWMQNFASMRDKFIQMGVDYRRGVNRAQNAQDVGSIVAFLTANPLNFGMTIAAQSDNETVRDIVKNVGYLDMANNLANLASNAFNQLQNVGSIVASANDVAQSNVSELTIFVADATNNVADATITTLVEDVAMDYTDLGLDSWADLSASTDYGMAVPGFGDAMQFDSYWDDSYLGNITDMGETYWGETLPEFSDPLTNYQDFTPMEAVPTISDETFGQEFIDLGSAAVEGVWVSGSDLPSGETGTSQGLSPSQLIQGGKQVYTMAGALAGQNRAGQSTQRNAGQLTQRTQGDTTGSVLDVMRAIRGGVNTASDVTREVRAITRDARTLENDIKATLKPSTNQMNVLRRQPPTSGATSNNSLFVIGGLALLAVMAG